jgi:hypothetical protein
MFTHDVAKVFDFPRHPPLVRQDISGHSHQIRNLVSRFLLVKPLKSLQSLNNALKAGAPVVLIKERLKQVKE